METRKVAIMQPYFFPYIGYFQLINAVDTFVIYDDVNYIKKGWINRNKILLNGKEKRINLQIAGASQNKLINESRGQYICYTEGASQLPLDMFSSFISVYEDNCTISAIHCLDKSFQGNVYFHFHRLT